MSDVTRGLDHDLKIRKDQKRKQQRDREIEILEWIEKVTGEQIDKDDPHKSLKSGHILIKLVNSIKNGIVPKFNKMNMPFAHMENISAFLNACKTLGVPDHDRFMTVDLYEAKDMGQVFQCLESLGRVAQKIPEYKGPTIGATLATKQEPKEFKNNDGSVGRLLDQKVHEIGKSLKETPEYSIKYQVKKVSEDEWKKEMTKFAKKEETKEEEKKEEKKELSAEQKRLMDNLTHLKDKGIISEEVFEEGRKKILELKD